MILTNGLPSFALNWLDILIIAGIIIGLLCVKASPSRGGTYRPKAPERIYSLDHLGRALNRKPPPARND